MSPTNGSNMKSIAKRVACKRWTFDAKDSGIVLFLHGNLRWNGKLLKQLDWIRSFRSTMVSFPRVSNKATRGKKLLHPRIRTTLQGRAKLHNRPAYNINTRLAFKQWLDVLVSFDFFDRQSNTQQDWGQKCGRLLGDFVIDLSYCKLIRGI